MMKKRFLTKQTFHFLELEMQREFVPFEIMIHITYILMIK